MKIDRPIDNSKEESKSSSEKVVQSFETSNFFIKSKEIANDYIESVVFLDDRAYNVEPGEQSDVHNLNATKISSLFAKEKKICAFYDPDSASDIEDFKEISQKADIVILDWFIDLEEEDSGSDDDDATDDDIRGKYTKEVISSIINKTDNNSLKLILVYTGETNLNEIVEEIAVLDKTSILNEEHCEILIDNIKILVRAKSNNEDKPDERFKHILNLKDKVLNYSDLPNFILEEYTKMTAGLLSNFALLSLTTLRKNSNKILGLFDKTLDPAYISHQSLISNKEDANELIVELIKDAFGSLLKYGNVNKFLDDTFLEDWIHANIVEKEKPVLKPDGQELGKTYVRDKKFVQSILKLSKLTNADMKKEYEALMGLTKTGDFWINNHISFFSDLPLEELLEINKKFAILTHHKSLYIPVTHVPSLSLGTVCKSSRGYYVCIQQRCDSVRINQEEERRFLFIPLKEVEGSKGFDFITPQGLKLKVENKSFNLRTIKFNGDEDGLVRAQLIKNEFYFIQKYKGEDDEKFQWVFDLKDMHAQGIISNYSAQLSRVGLDESEWLRRS